LLFSLYAAISGEDARQRRQFRKGGGGSTNSRAGNNESRRLVLREGVRVHARADTKSGPRFLPGRIVRVIKGSGSVDVEFENGRVERGVLSSDIIQGLEEGQLVEARRPSVVQLEATGLCWSSSGSALAVSYGRTDIPGKGWGWVR